MSLVLLSSECIITIIFIIITILFFGRCFMYRMFAMTTSLPFPLTVFIIFIIIIIYIHLFHHHPNLPSPQPHHHPYHRNHRITFTIIAPSPASKHLSTRKSSSSFICSRLVQVRPFQGLVSSYAELPSFAFVRGREIR